MNFSVHFLKKESLAPGVLRDQMASWLGHQMEKQFLQEPLEQTHFLGSRWLQLAQQWVASGHPTHL